MRRPSSERKVRRARFIVKWVAQLHRLRIPFTRRVVLPLNVAGLEKSLCEIHDAFERHGICFWLRDGTALGIVRDGRIIAGDDDVDLGVWPHDLPALEGALSDLENQGFVVYKHTRWIIGLLKRWESIEIVISSSWGQDDEHNHYIDSFFTELKSVTYLDRQFNVPRDTEAYLEFSYGEDWRTPKPHAWWSSTYWLPHDERSEYRRRFMSRAGGRRPGHSEGYEDD